MADIWGHAPAGATIRLSPYDGSDPLRAKTGKDRVFRFPGQSVGQYILAASLPGFRETVKSISWGRNVPGHVVPVDFDLAPLPGVLRGPIPVVTVCEALNQCDSLTGQPAVVVGVFKSGIDETLRLDCGAELRSGDLGWPSAVGLTKVAQPPENLRNEIEKKRQQILKSAPPEAPLRPERVMGLYGRFVSVAGLTSEKCCASAVQTNLPPARLFGLDEKDLRVIR